VIFDAPKHENDAGHHAEDQSVGEVSVKAQLDHIPPQSQRSGGLNQG